MSYFVKGTKVMDSSSDMTNGWAVCITLHGHVSCAAVLSPAKLRLVHQQDSHSERFIALVEEHLFCRIPSCNACYEDGLSQVRSHCAAGVAEWHLSLDCKLSPPGLLCCCLFV